MEGAAIYCVLRSAGMKNRRQTTLLMAVSKHLQLLVLPLLAKNICEKSKNPDLKIGVFLIGCGFLRKVGNCALVKLGVQLVGWKLDLAIWGAFIFMTQSLFPSKSQDQHALVSQRIFK